MEWISISTKLPNKIGHLRVIVTTDKNFISIATFSDYGWNFDNCSYDEEFEGKVTHWMPLPNQPERSKREDYGKL